MAGGVLLFGGSFNPIHHGHLIVARAAAERLSIGQVVLIPSANPPHKSRQDLADAADRLEMVRRAAVDETGFSVSDIELSGELSAPNYTLNTVRALRDRLGASVPLHWLIGADTLPELHTWYRVGELVTACRIVTAARPGFETPDLSGLAGAVSVADLAQIRAGILSTPRVDISATDIRERVRQGRSIRYLVPEAVCEHIERRGLYRE